MFKVLTLSSLLLVSWVWFDSTVLDDMEENDVSKNYVLSETSEKTFFQPKKHSSHSAKDVQENAVFDSRNSFRGVQSTLAKVKGGSGVIVASKKMGEYEPKRLRVNSASLSKPSLLQRIRANPVALAGAAVYGSAEGENEKLETLGSFEYRVKEFYPGLTGSGNVIRDRDLSSIQSIVVGKPDFSPYELNIQRDRILPLGHSGTIILEVKGGYITDGEGADFIIFENPIQGDDNQVAFPEKALVSVAWNNDPKEYRYFNCESTEYPYEGCAGVKPVNYRDDAKITEVGGDHFDLATVGLRKVRYIRIEDTGDNVGVMEGSEGFDLDAMGIVHGKAFKK